jgi:hypothetical protein
MNKYIEYAHKITKDIPDFKIELFKEALQFGNEEIKIKDINGISLTYYGHDRYIGKESEEGFTENGGGKLTNLTYGTTYWKCKNKYIKCRCTKHYIYKNHWSNGIKKIKVTKEDFNFIDINDPSEKLKLSKKCKDLIKLATDFYATSYYKKYMIISCPSKILFDRMDKDATKEFGYLILENDYCEVISDTDLSNSDPECDWSSENDYC